MGSHLLWLMVGCRQQTAVGLLCRRDLLVTHVTKLLLMLYNPLFLLLLRLFLCAKGCALMNARWHALLPTLLFPTQLPAHCLSPWRSQHASWGLLLWLNEGFTHVVLALT
jgi:hypothetical protein